MLNALLKNTSCQRGYKFIFHTEPTMKIPVLVMLIVVAMLAGLSFIFSVLIP